MVREVWKDMMANETQKMDPWNFGPAYGQSKTANILHSVSVAEKLKSKRVQAFSLHPGSSWTGLVNNLPTDELVRRGKGS